MRMRRLAIKCSSGAGEATPGFYPQAAGLSCCHGWHVSVRLLVAWQRRVDNFEDARGELVGTHVSIAMAASVVAMSGWMTILTPLGMSLSTGSSDPLGYQRARL